MLHMLTPYESFTEESFDLAKLLLFSNQVHTHGCYLSITIQEKFSKVK